MEKALPSLFATFLFVGVGGLFSFNIMAGLRAERRAESGAKAVSKCGVTGRQEEELSTMNRSISGIKE